MFKILDEKCTPKRATKNSAMVDLFANADVVIGAGETKIVPLGVKIDLKAIKRRYFIDEGEMFDFAMENLKGFEKWVETPDGIFEFELYDGKVVDFNDISNDEFDDSLVSYYCLKFNTRAYEEFLSSHFIELRPRSSLRNKGLIIGAGVIDLDYPDEIGLIVYKPLSFKSVMNIAIKAINKIFHAKNMLPFVKDEYVVTKYDKIAQCTLIEHKGYMMGIKSDVVRSGGYGSSGK